MQDSYTSVEECLEQAKERIEELEKSVELLTSFNDQNELLNFPWVGNLGHWCWLVETNKVYCNEGKLKAIGYTRDELGGEIGYEFFTKKLHPDDYDRVMENMMKHLLGEASVYEVEYRIRAKDGSYKWFYDRGKITQKNTDGKPAMLAGIVFDITRQKDMELKLKEANEKLRELAIKDELTETLNKRMITKKIEQEIIKVKRYGSPLSVIMFDIDHFKKVNDSYGHKIGDEVLKAISFNVKERIRQTDYLGRWGGEEFIIALPNTGQDEAVMLAENLRKIIEKTRLEQGVSVTASFGVLAASKEDDVDSVFSKVDGLMYQAKTQGRNKVIFK